MICGFFFCWENSLKRGENPTGGPRPTLPAAPSKNKINLPLRRVSECESHTHTGFHVLTAAKKKRYRLEAMVQPLKSPTPPRLARLDLSTQLMPLASRTKALAASDPGRAAPEPQGQRSRRRRSACAWR